MKKSYFNAGWMFCKVKSEQAVTLPHDAMILEKRSESAKSGSAGGYFAGGKYVYKKKFTAPEEAHAILEFEGVYGVCTVFLNGKRVAKNLYGYNNFFVDLSGRLVAGENNLEVKVDNSAMVNSRWYTGSGIYRSVWLYTGGDSYIVPDSLHISMPEIEPDIAKAEITFEFFSGAAGEKLFIQTEIEDGDGRLVHSSKTPYSIFQAGKQHVRIPVYLHNPRLWSTQTPALYTCTVSLLKGDKIIERDSSRFGIRKLQVDPVNGLRINVEKILLRGACIHQDNGIIGACEYEAASLRRIKKLKEAGFNAIRISHQPCAKPMLKACDELGMLVLEETFDMWEEAKTPFDYAQYFATDHKNVLTNTVNKDFNHPCVIMYSIGNEIPEIVKPQGAKISRELSDYLRLLDPTRPITNAINGLCATTGNTLPILMELGLVTKEQIAAITGDPESDNTSLFNVILAAVASGDINDAMTALAGNLGRVVEHKSVGEKLHETVSHLDVCGYNYMKARYAVDAREYPDRVLLGTETMPPDIDLLWQEVKNIPQLIGDFTWTGWDYIGEAGVGHTNYEGKSEFAVAYPGYLAYCGDIDITGYRRPMSYLREIVFGLREEPYLSVQHPKHYGKPAKTYQSQRTQRVTGQRRLHHAHGAAGGIQNASLRRGMAGIFKERGA